MMKRINFLYLSVVSFFLVSCSGSSSTTIEGENTLSLYEGKMIYLYMNSVDDENLGKPLLIDSTKIENGKFSFADIDKLDKLSGALPTVGFMTLFNSTKELSEEDNNSPTCMFVIEKGNIKASIEESYIAVSGTKINEDLNAVQDALEDLFDLVDEVNALGNINDMPVNAQGEDGRAVVQKANQKFADTTYNFIGQNMSNKVGEFFLLKSFGDNIFTPKQLITLIEQGSKNFQSHPDIVEMKADLAAMGDNHFILGDDDDSHIIFGDESPSMVDPTEEK